MDLIYLIVLTYKKTCTKVQIAHLVGKGYLHYSTHQRVIGIVNIVKYACLIFLPNFFPPFFKPHIASERHLFSIEIMKIIKKVKIKYKQCTSLQESFRGIYFIKMNNKKYCVSNFLLSTVTAGFTFMSFHVSL